MIESEPPERAVSWFRRPRGPEQTGTLNLCYNALDRHVIAGRADRLALLVVGAEGVPEQAATFAQLLDEVARGAGALRELGVRAGDPVLLHLPVGAALVVTVLAAARIGAVSAVLPGDAPVAALAETLDRLRPAVVVTAETGPVREAVGRSDHRPAHLAVVPGTEPRVEPLADGELDWFLITRPGLFEPGSCAELALTDPLTVVPDGSAPDEDHGAVVSLAHALRELGVTDDDGVLVGADLAGAPGRASLVCAPLLAGAATVLVAGPAARAGSLRQLRTHGVEGAVVELGWPLETSTRVAPV